MGIHWIIFTKDELICEGEEAGLSFGLQDRVVCPGDLERAQEIGKAPNRLEVFEGPKLQQAGSQLFSGQCLGEVAVEGGIVMKDFPHPRDASVQVLLHIFQSVK